MLYQVSKASKSYGADTVFENVTFEIRGTEKIALVGRNGCGKTTFLRCMSGEESLTKGLSPGRTEARSDIFPSAFLNMMSVRSRKNCGFSMSLFLPCSGV